MRYIKKENGKVYQIEEHDAEGRHITKTYLGIDPEAFEKLEDKPIIKKKKKRSRLISTPLIFVSYLKIKHP